MSRHNQTDEAINRSPTYTIRGAMTERALTLGRKGQGRALVVALRSPKPGSGLAPLVGRYGQVTKDFLQLFVVKQGIERIC
jgi:hypothetical protein